MTRWLAVAALGAAALAVAADDPNAPLAQSKEQLQSLKKDEAAQKAVSQGGVKVDLPAIAAPAQPLDLPAPRREDSTSSNNAPDGKNWLLDGYDKLDEQRGRSNPKRGDGKANENPAPLDPSAPDYFLRVYERQRAERDAKAREFDRLHPNERKSDATDPFAPFMKDWLTNSPVRDALKDSLGRQTTDTGMLPAAESVSPSDSVAPAAPVVGETLRETGTNPFVHALGLPPPLPKPSEVHSPIASTPTQPMTPAPSSPANTIYDLPERSKPDLKQSLPPPPSEDKKYFPQLKKF